MLGECIQEGRRGRVAQGRGRGQGNFKLAANFGYGSRGSADPRESLRKRRISKLPLTAQKVLPAERSNDCRCALVETFVAGMVRFF